ncbi:MAG: SCO family protein [Polyangiales bacterium]
MKRVRWLVWSALIVAGIAAYAATQLGASRRTERGDFGKVPAFSLTDQRGGTVTDADLRGKVWVANFVFTRCPSVCPLLTAKFKALQERIGPLEGVRYVSMSVDPKHDTPEVLAAYAQKFGADPERWRFVTGALETIEKTVVKGFKIHIGEPTPSAHDPSLVEIMHGEHLVLVDATGTIRGYYRAEAPELEELERDVRALADERVAQVVPQLVQ